MERLRALAGLGPLETTLSSVAQRGYLTPTAPDDARREASIQKTLAFLRGVEVADDGAPVFESKLLPSGQIEVAVHALAPASARLRTPAGELRYEELVEIEERAGNHAVDGILILRGPRVRRGVRLQGARLEDVTPTLLYLNRLAVGADMDGTVLWNAIDPVFRDEHPVERIASWDERVSIERASDVAGDMDATLRVLRDLGYVGDRENR